MKNELMRTRSIRLAVLMATVLGLTACSHKASSDEGGGGTADAMVAEVTLTRVARADISQMLTVTGTVSALPNQDVRVSALVPGRIAQMKVAEGDHVEIGQVLAKLDDRPLRDQLRQAEAAASQAKANLENAKLSLERNETLFARGIAARKDLDDARTQQSVAAAALRQAEAALELAHLQVARTEILSPLNGMVVKRFVNVGEQVDGTAAQPVVEVANLSQVELFGNLPAIYLAKIHVGQTLPVTSDALPGKTLPGRVVAISPAVDPATNVGTVRIRIANQQHLLRLGVFLTAQVAIETHAQALTVPPQAIYRDEEGQPRVFRVEKENATAVPVTLGIEAPDRVELLSGVNEGETVILTGGYGLGDKAKIKVKS
jgi:membrane fusion protein (multidrug efflux system)